MTRKKKLRNEIQSLKDQLHLATTLNAATTRDVDEVLRKATKEGIRFGEFPGEAVKRGLDALQQEVHKFASSLGRAHYEVEEVVKPIIGVSEVQGETLAQRVARALAATKG
jgi:hypothetical protein